ncbi:MAG: hypothetical protein ACI9KE_004540 [Polyangiales bacterium]|jgi:hypothetical protein
MNLSRYTSLVLIGGLLAAPSLYAQDAAVAEAPEIAEELVAPALVAPIPVAPPPPLVPPTPPPVVPPETLEDVTSHKGDGWTAHSGAHRAAALVFGDSHHALTTTRVIRDRGSIHLVNEDGESVLATYVAHNRWTGLVLLRTEADLGAHAEAGEHLVAGDTVRFRARHRRHEHHPRGDVQTVVLSLRTNRLTLGAQCTEGEGIYSQRDGSLAGICTGDEQAASVHAAQELFGRHDTPEARSAWRLRLSFDLRYRIQSGFNSVVAGELGIGVLGFNRLGFALRGGIAADAEQDDDGPLTLDSPIEVTGEVQLHQAFRFGGASRLVLALGATFRYQRTVTTTTTADFDGCDISAGPCPVVFAREQTTDTEYRVLPMGRVEFDMGNVALSYVIHLDIDEVKNSTHSFGIGLVY